MGTFILQVIGIICAFCMIKYREMIGDAIGEQTWMAYVGGVYNFIMIIAVFLFFWSVAGMTGTTGIFFAPLTWFFAGLIG